MLLIRRTVMLIIAGNALGNVNPFSIDLSDFCRSFRVESTIRIKIYIVHDVLNNEVDYVIEANKIFETDHILKQDQLLDAK